MDHTKEGTDAAYGSSLRGLPLGCRLSYIIDLPPSSLRDPHHVIHWSSRFTRREAKSSLGGEAYALSEMLDQMELSI